MAVLNDREKDVLMKRRLSETPVTLEELSEGYGVSRERIRQIEVRAFEKLQERMRELARGKGMMVPAGGPAKSAGSDPDLRKAARRLC